MSDEAVPAGLVARMDPAYATALQNAVVDQLGEQTREVVLYGEPDVEAFAAMLALLGLPMEQRRAIMLHPTFRFWLQGMRRASVAGLEPVRRDLLARLSSFVWSLRGLSGRRVWTDSSGGLRCPAAGRHVELGDAYADQPVEATPEEGEVVLRCRDGLTVRVPYEDLDGAIEEPPPTVAEHGYSLTLSPRLAQGRIEVSRRDPWLRAALSGTNQRTDGVDFFAVDDAAYPRDARLEVVAAALDEIAEMWPEAHADIAEFTRVIVPVAPPPGVLPRARGADGPVNLAFTVSSRQGALYLGEADVDATIEMLLHENAHIKLRQAQAIDPLLCDPLDESVRLPVPWRPDPRPIPGILEGLFVFAHVAEFELRRRERAPHRVPRDRLAARLGDLRYAADCLTRNAAVTAEGTSFLTQMQGWLDALETRLGPA